MAAEEILKQKEEAVEDKRRQEALLEEQNQIQNEIMKLEMEKMDQQQQPPVISTLNPGAIH